MDASISKVLSHSHMPGRLECTATEIAQCAFHPYGVEAEAYHDLTSDLRSDLPQTQSDIQLIAHWEIAPENGLDKRHSTPKLQRKALLVSTRHCYGRSRRRKSSAYLNCGLFQRVWEWLIIVAMARCRTYAAGRKAPGGVGCHRAQTIKLRRLACRQVGQLLAAKLLPPLRKGPPERELLMWDVHDGIGRSTLWRGTLAWF